jgi:chemotaxis protein MotB
MKQSDEEIAEIMSDKKTFKKKEASKEDENSEDVQSETLEAQAAYVSPRFRHLRKGNEEEEVPLWLITFTDTIALMLTFFVLLYSMATPSKERFEEMTSAMTRQFGQYFSQSSNAGPQDAIEIDRIDFSSALDLNYLQSLLQARIENDDLLRNVLIIKQKKRLVISVPSELLFDQGKAEIQVDGRRALFALGDILSRIRNAIEIIGHSDPTPMTSRNGPYQSNWDLSLARASHVAGVLNSVGYKRAMTVRGLSSARYDQLPDSVPEDERLNYARRVDIVLLENDGNVRGLMDFGN